MEETKPQTLQRLRNGCFKGSVLLIATVLVGFVVYWVSVTGYQRPSISVEDLYIPTLDNTSKNNTQNTTISYVIRFRKENHQNSVRYSTINLTIYYGHSLSFPVANVSIPGFHQRFLTRAHRRGAVESIGVPWDMARREVSMGTTMFRVSLNTTVKYTMLFWHTKRRKFAVGSTVMVNNLGRLVKTHQHGVRLTRVLTSGAAPSSRYVQLGGLVGFAFVFLCIL
ncbi:hypothetical protein ACHQM5_029826 [Ranunculus cassubicifolius]